MKKSTQYNLCALILIQTLLLALLGFELVTLGYRGFAMLIIVAIAINLVILSVIERTTRKEQNEKKVTIDKKSREALNKYDELQKNEIKTEVTS